METISILWWFEDLACDWSENNEHSRHILGVHGFRSLTVKMDNPCDELSLLMWKRDLVEDKLSSSDE